MAFIFKCYHHLALHVQECTCILFLNILVLVMFFWNVQCKVDQISTSDDAESVYCLPLSENLQHIQYLLWRLLKSLSCIFCFIFTLDDNKRMELIQKTCCLPASYILPFDGKMHKYMPYAFKCMYSISCVATFLAKRIVADLGSDPCNNTKLYVIVYI
jgi:hypothetical protein